MISLTKIWSSIEKNRWTTIIPVVGLILWVVLSFSCVVKTLSPTRDGALVTPTELKLDYQTWVADCNATAEKFRFAGADIERQQAEWSKITSVLMQIASGGVTNYSGLLNIVLASGMLGIGADNVRKNGVIAGLKRGKKRKSK